MHSCSRARSLFLPILAIVGVAYPVLVCFGLQVLPPSTVVIGLLMLVGLRLLLGQHGIAKSLTYVCWIAMSGLVLLAVWEPLAALKAYPVLLSLGLAGLFGYSLIHPPTVVERIARIRDPNLPDSATRYLRNVTVVWFGFFIVNASVSTWAALSGDLTLWTFYNGFVSYVLIGALFIGEFVLRSYLRRRKLLAP
jgi:uncharacterized membrane protein